MTREQGTRCGGPLCLAPVPKGALEEGASAERLRAGARVVCLRSCERGVVVSIDDFAGEALVAFGGSQVVRALCDLTAV